MYLWQHSVSSRFTILGNSGVGLSVEIDMQKREEEIVELAKNMDVKVKELEKDKKGKGWLAHDIS